MFSYVFICFQSSTILEVSGIYTDVRQISGLSRNLGSLGCLPALTPLHSIKDVGGIHLEHVKRRNREDGLQSRIRLNGPALVKSVLLDISPDELGHLRARQNLKAARNHHQPWQPEDSLMAQIFNKS